jgi:hypothetical protein
MVEGGPPSVQLTALNNNLPLSLCIKMFRGVELIYYQGRSHDAHGRSREK